MKSSQIYVTNVIKHSQNLHFWHDTWLSTQERGYSSASCAISNLHKKKQMIEHSQTHVNKADWKYDCNICKAKHPSKSYLTKHMKRHHLGKNYKCDLCHFASATFQDRKRHIIVCHTTIKPFPCTLCSYTFAIKTQLKTHTARAHVLKHN